VSGQLDYENKLMYWGSVDGVMTTFPAIMWTRADGTCGDKYDPRRRPWYLSGSNGPKNVIFILDSSGSMSVRD
jgi:voltage-dependent calcium channel alpha-2/delta-3